MSALAVGALALSLAQVLAPASATEPTDPPVENPVATGNYELTASGDTFVQSGLDGSSKPTSPELRVGTNNGGINKARSYATFDVASIGTIDPESVLSATVTVSNFAAGSCSGSAIRLSRVTSAWALPTIKWGVQPTTTAVGSTTNDAGHGRTGCVAEGPVVFDVKEIVKAWAGGAPNLGVQLKADAENANASWRRFRSLENGNAVLAPKLFIKLDEPPAIPTDLTITPSTLSGETTFVNSRTPTIAATVTDPDDDLVKAFVKVEQGPTTVWTGTSAEVATGEEASVTLPADTLAEGGTYVISLWGEDPAGVRSALPLTAVVTVDSVAPTLTIASSPFVNGAWTTTLPATSTFTFDGSADVGGFYIDFDGVTGAVGADANGNRSQSWTPTNGWHRLAVKAVDKAGNVGPETVFTFGTGSGTITAPTMWAASTGSFPLEASAPPNAATGYVEWRLFNETPWRRAQQVKNADGTAWLGAMTGGTARSTTGSLTWNATDEPLGTGTLDAPALVEVRVCFNYPTKPGACTASRYVTLFVPEAEPESGS